MPQAVQWVKVPSGASGSSTTSTSSIEPAGSARQASVGLRPSPSQVMAFGIAAPSLKSGVENSIVSGAAGRLDVCLSSPPPQPARAAAAQHRS